MWPSTPPRLSIFFLAFITKVVYVLFFFPFIFISWRLITLQYCSGFLSYIDMNEPWIYMCSPFRWEGVVYVLYSYLVTVSLPHQNVKLLKVWLYMWNLEKWYR